MKLKAKIIGAAACAFALCVALAGCAGAPAGNDAANFQGDWILTSGTVDGQEATEETLAQAQEMGLSVYLQRAGHQHGRLLDRQGRHHGGTHLRRQLG